MAEIGLAIGGISLAAQVFNGCLVGLQTISRARYSDKSLLDFTTKLDLEIARLIIWGRNSGLTRGQLDESLVPIRPLLLEILTNILSSIESTDKLKSTYGIVLVEDHGTGTTDGRTRSRSRTVKSLDILSIAELLPEVERQTTIAERLKKEMKLYRKIKWAAWDEEKAKRFVDSIKGFVDGLNQLLTESQKATLDAETTAMRIAILGTNWAQPLKMLHTLETATAGRYESLALPARLARFRLELEMEEAAPLPLESDTLPAQALEIGDDQLRPLDADRSYATFHNSEILVEWRTLRTSEADGERGRARTKQAAKLAGLFKELNRQTAEYRVLECIGYLDQKGHVPPRLGIAFTMPTALPNEQFTKPFYSLHDYLSSRKFEDFQPDLGSRFELARKLTRGFLQFHQLGWLHKSIRSHNIIFFSQDRSESVESPYILGFAYSRPTERGISDNPAADADLDIYCHPDYQAEAKGSFRLRYDIFSIGLLLFEIAKWRPLGNYFHRLKREDQTLTAGTFVAKLLEMESNDLEFRMGTHYKSAVLTCLDGSFGVEGDDALDKRLKLAFFEKVVKPLDYCRA